MLTEFMLAIVCALAPFTMMADEPVKQQAATAEKKTVANKLPDVKPLDKSAKPTVSPKPDDSKSPTDPKVDALLKQWCEKHKSLKSCYAEFELEIHDPLAKSDDRIKKRIGSFRAMRNPTATKTTLPFLYRLDIKGEESFVASPKLEWWYLDSRKHSVTVDECVVDDPQTLPGVEFQGLYYLGRKELTENQPWLQKLIHGFIRPPAVLFSMGLLLDPAHNAEPDQIKRHYRIKLQPESDPLVHLLVEARNIDPSESFHGKLMVNEKTLIPQQFHVQFSDRVELTLVISRFDLDIEINASDFDMEAKAKELRAKGWTIDHRFPLKPASKKPTTATPKHQGATK